MLRKAILLWIIAREAGQWGIGEADAVIDPYECWLHREQVPDFLAGYAAAAREVVDVDDVLDRLLDTDVGRGRWLVLPVGGPLRMELGAEPGTGAVEVRAFPTGPGADELLAALRPLGAVYGR